MLFGSHLLCVVATFVIIFDNLKPVAAKPANTEMYTSRFDSINIDEILHSDRLLKVYVDCVMDRGSCTREGKELKRIIPDALATECSKCNPLQKKRAGHILSYILQNKRHYWDELVEKYDPDQIFRKKYLIDENDEEDEEED